MSYNLSTLIDQFLQYASVRNAPGTVDYYQRHLKRFMEHIGDMAVTALKPWHLLSWGRTWHQIQSVQRLFHWGHVEAGLLDANPFNRVKRPCPGARRRTLSRRDLACLLRATDAMFRPFLLAMRETIARPQEVRALRWEHLRRLEESRTVPQALAEGSACFELLEYKGRLRRSDPGRPRLLLISPRLGRLLLRLWERGGALDGPVFVNSQGKPWTTNAVRLRMKRVRARLGWKPDSRGEQIVAYTIRHTQATAAVAQGLRDRMLAEMMGHTSTRTTSRYQHLDVGHMREAMNRFNGGRPQRS